MPHPDVLEGTFQQSEFAADITAVRTGKATREYQDAGAFFQRTFITEGMRLLLTSVAKRLNGKGGDPVIQLQGGKKKEAKRVMLFHVTFDFPPASHRDFFVSRPTMVTWNNMSTWDRLLGTA